MCVTKKELEAKIFAAVVVTDTGCWEWQRARSSTGYGAIAVDRKTRGVHRVSYEVFIGPIPDGLCVMHRCDNPPCCNPAHLMVGTKGDNNADRAAKGRSSCGNAVKTHCKHGHPFTEPPVNGRRTCKPCRKRHQEKYRAENRELINQKRRK